MAYIELHDNLSLSENQMLQLQVCEPMISNETFTIILVFRTYRKLSSFVY